MSPGRPIPAELSPRSGRQLHTGLMASLARLAYQPLIGRFSLPWRWALYAALALLVVTNLLMVALQIALIVSGSDALDWIVYGVMVERFEDGTLYQPAEWWYGPRYSPVAVLPMVAIAWVGETAWRALHLVALLALPGWTRLIALASYPFWLDVHAGNIMAFVLVAAFWALRGNRWAIGATLVIALLVPRPMMLPLAAWLLWQHPGWRWPFVGLFVAHAVGVVASGYAVEWAVTLIGAADSGSGVGSWLNVAPSALVGLWWMLAAVPLSAYAFWRGYPATAGLLLQPYWLPQYLLMPLADRWERPASRALPAVADGSPTWRFPARRT